MQKVYQKIKKKLGQAVSTISSIESKDFKQLVCSETTGKYLIVHFGQGTETDFVSLNQIMNTIGLHRQKYSLEIYPGYPHAYLELFDLENKELISEFLKKSNKELHEKTNANTQNSENSKIENAIINCIQLCIGGEIVNKINIVVFKFFIKKFNCAIFLIHFR